jgi:hypothetical protein
MAMAITVAKNLSPCSAEKDMKVAPAPNADPA